MLRQELYILLHIVSQFNHEGLINTSIIECDSADTTGFREVCEQFLEAKKICPKSSIFVNAANYGTLSITMNCIFYTPISIQAVVTLAFNTVRQMGRHKNAKFKEIYGFF